MKKLTKDTIKIYFGYIRRKKAMTIPITVAAFIIPAFGVIIPLFTKKFFDNLASGPSDQVIKNLIGVIITVAIIQMIRWSVFRVSNVACIIYQADALKNVSLDCFKYLHRHSFSFFSNNFVGSLVKKASRFASSFDALIDKLYFEYPQFIVKIILIVIILFIKNYVLGLCMLVWIITSFVLNYFFAKYKYKLDVKAGETDSENTGILADTIANHSNVKLFANLGKEISNYTQSAEGLKKIRVKSWLTMEAFQAINALMISMLEIGLMLIAVQLFKDGRLTVGDFVILQTYILLVADGVWRFGTVLQKTFNDFANAEEMAEILTTPHEIVDSPSAIDLEITNGKIEFNNVDFYYHQTRQILDKFNLTIKAGEKIALVGPSGAGKTTILKLLIRTYEATSGTIKIDGQAIEKVKLESLWRNVGLVPQEPILFHRSLLENIGYGRPGATREEIIEAAKQANCHQFISDLPEQYETMVGERGVKLSGGERQRVSIARTILYNPPILLLDEATSSLDSESEQLIQGAMDNLMKNKTVVVIAHRLSTVIKMDRIIVLANGQIIETGNHEELLKNKKGLYYKLWHIQVGGYNKLI